MGEVNCRECISYKEDIIDENNINGILCREHGIIKGGRITSGYCICFSPKKKGKREKTLEAENKELKDKTEELREELQMCQRSWLLEGEKNVALMKQLGRRDKKIKKLKKRNDNIANQMIDMINACDTCKKSDLKDVNRKQKLSISILKTCTERYRERIRELKEQNKNINNELTIIAHAYTELKELNKSTGESVGELTDLKYTFTSLQETNKTLGDDNLKLIDTIENLKKELTDSEVIISEVQESERYCVLDKMKLEEKIEGQRKEIEQLARLSNVNVDTINEQNAVIKRLLKEE